MEKTLTESDIFNDMVSPDVEDFHPEGAKALLQQAGYDSSNPLKVDMYVAEVIPAMVNLAQLYKSQAAKAGARWADATATSTMGSPTASLPTR